MSDFLANLFAYITKKQTNICCTVGTPLFILNKESSEGTFALLCKRQSFSHKNQFMRA